MRGLREEACFAGQQKMASDMGVSVRHLRRYLQELEDAGYVRIKRRGLNRPNLYYILDVRTKLRRRRAKADRTLVSHPERTKTSHPERTRTSA